MAIALPRIHLPRFPRWLSLKAAVRLAGGFEGGARAAARAAVARRLLSEGGGDLVAVELLEVVGEHHQPPLGSD